jgi:hypothetical protein
MKLALTASILAISILAGCATEVMKGYIGKPIQEPILDYGPPANIVELGGGRRGYQFQINSSGVIPMSTPSSSTIYGSGGYATVNTQSTSYVPYSSECLYTLTATKQGETYIVDGYRQPRFDCL